MSIVLLSSRVLAPIFAGYSLHFKFSFGWVFFLFHCLFVSAQEGLLVVYPPTSVNLPVQFASCFLDGQNYLTREETSHPCLVVD